MTIYFLMVLMIILQGHRQRKGLESSKRYCFIIGSLFAVVTGLRSDIVGSDTTVYLLGYEQLSDISSLAMALYGHSESGYYTFAWCFSRMGLPFWCLTFVVAIFFYFAVSRFIYEYSEDKPLSYLILMAFNFFQFSMTGIRQTIALGFVLLALYEVFKPKYHLWKILLYIGIGYQFHNSCAVALLLIPILYLKKSTGPVLVNISLVVLFIGFILREQLMEFMLLLGADSRFSGYEIKNTGAGVTTYLVFVLIYLTLIFNRQNYISHSHRGSLDIWLLFFAVLFQATVLVQPVMFRIAWYFAISLIIILPGIIRALPLNLRTVGNLTVYACVLVMYFGITIGSANVVPYRFFWQ